MIDMQIDNIGRDDSEYSFLPVSGSIEVISSNLEDLSNVYELGATKSILDDIITGDKIKLPQNLDDLINECTYNYILSTNTALKLSGGSQNAPLKGS